MERQAQVSCNPITAAVDRADQNTTCCLSLPAWSVSPHAAGQTGTHKLCAPHLQIPTRDCSLPGMPFPPLPSSPSSFLLSARICNFHSADTTRFVFRKYNKQMNRTGNPWVTSVPRWNQAESAPAISGSQEGSEGSGRIGGVRQLPLGLLPQPLPRGTGLISDSALCGPVTHLPTKHTAWDFLKGAEAKRQEKHKLLLWPWLLSSLIIVSLKMKVTGLKI